MKERKKTPFCVSSKNVPEARPKPKSVGKGARLTTKMVYGTDMSVMVATRDSGYHSAPHIHDAEQLCYVVEGKIWIFVGEDGFEAVKGDFFRVPRGKVHWAWVRSPGLCTLFEVHAPPLTGDAELKENAYSLLAPDEDQSAVKGIENLFVDYPKYAEVEKRLCGETP